MNGLASVLDDCVIEYSDLSGLRIDFKVDHVGSEGPTRPLWVNGALTGDSAAALGQLAGKFFECEFQVTIRSVL